MLLEFAVQNFKSFKELQVFSLEASTEPKNDDGVNRIIEKDGYRVVKTKAIYGANASGKSNLILGLVAMWKIMNENLRDDDIFQHFIFPYKLDYDLINKPSYFQIIFIHNGEKYRYGFEIDDEKIHSEWLYVKKKKEVVLFEREGNKIVELNENSFREGKLIRQGIKMFNDRTLVVTVLDQLSSPISTIVKESINRKIVISANIPSRNRFMNHWFMQTLHLFEKDEIFQQWTTDMLYEIDPSIKSLKLQSIKLPNGQLDKVPIIIRKTDNYEIPFTLESEEASGTMKVFGFASIIYDALNQGKALIIDEMDAMLHPKLTRKIIELFQSPDAHPEAQLIFATHDTNLMDNELLRRDQITFVEKSDSGMSEIFDLSDIKGVRAKDLFEKNYLKGNYGALPTLNNLEKVLFERDLVNG